MYMNSLLFDYYLPAWQACFQHETHHWWHWKQAQGVPGAYSQQYSQCATRKIKISWSWFVRHVKIEYESISRKVPYLIKRNFFDTGSCLAHSKWHCQYCICTQLNFHPKKKIFFFIKQEEFKFSLLKYHNNKLSEVNWNNWKLEKSKVPFVCTSPTHLKFHQVFAPCNCQFGSALLGPAKIMKYVELLYHLLLYNLRWNGNKIKWSSRIARTLPTNAGPMIAFTFSTAYIRKL